MRTAPLLFPIVAATLLSTGTAGAQSVSARVTAVEDAGPVQGALALDGVVRPITLDVRR